jgi:nucleoid-associated protein YgaU
MGAVKKQKPAPMKEEPKQEKPKPEIELVAPRKDPQKVLEEMKKELEVLTAITKPAVSPETFALQGIVSEIPSSRADRIAQQKLEEQTAKEEAKAQKGQPITKKKASLQGDDVYMEYVPEKEPFVLIDVPKLWRNTKDFFRSPAKFTKKHWVSMTTFVLVCIIATITAFILTGQKDQAEAPKTHTTNTITHNQSATATNLHKDAPVLPVVVEKGKVVDKPVSQAVQDTNLNKPVITPPTVKSYHVQTGDTLWDIAVAVYGDGTKWTRIYADNKDMLLQHDSRNAYAPGHWVHAGDVLLVHTE